MQENNEQVVTEEVKPVEVVPTEVQTTPEVQTVPVDEIVGQPTESNNNDNYNKGRSTREIVLIVIAALTMIASGVYFAFFNEDDETASGNNKPETTEKEDTKDTTGDETNNTASGETKTEEKSSIGPTVYYTNSFNSEKYDFNVIKNLATNDTITERDLSQEGKEITYTFTIENKKVVVSNSYDSKYTIDKITNAKQLLVTAMGQAPEYTGAFVVTEDNKLYSIRLFNSSNTSQVITDCKELENMVKEEMSNVKTISSGSLAEKNTTGGEGAVLIETNDNNKYVLATSEIKD